MAIGARFATLAYVEAMRRKLERMISGVGIAQPGSEGESVENFIEWDDMPTTSGVLVSTVTDGASVLSTFALTISDSGPSGGTDGDIWFEY